MIHVTTDCKINLVTKKHTVAETVYNLRYFYIYLKYYLKSYLINNALIIKLYRRETFHVPYALRSRYFQLPNEPYNVSGRLDS